MSALDKFSIFVIDDEEGPRTTVEREARARFTIDSRVQDKQLASLGIQRDLVLVKAFRSEAEGKRAIELIKEADRFTCFLLDADLSKDGQGGSLTGGLSLWRRLMETVGQEHYEEFFATIYTKSPQVQNVLAPIFNFTSSRPVFLDFGKTKIEITRVKEHIPLMADHFKRTSLSYALSGEFKAGPLYKHFNGQPEVEIDGRQVKVRSLVRNDLRNLISSSIGAEFWTHLGNALSGKKYYLEITEGRGFFWTRRFSLANLFPLETKAIVEQFPERRPDLDQIRTGLSLMLEGIFPSVQSEFYEFCKFFDLPFNRLTDIPKVVYNDEKRQAYLKVIADMASIFSGDTNSKLSHLAASSGIRRISSRDASAITAFLMGTFGELLHADIYCMDHLREQLTKINTGQELETFVTKVRSELIEFPEKPAEMLSGAVVDGLDNTLSCEQITGEWSFTTFPLYWVHIHQLLKVFILNFEKHNRDEFSRSLLTDIRVSFQPDSDRLTMQVSAPGSISDWTAITKSLENALSDNCEIEKLSGFRKIACDYYDAEVQIIWGNTMARATRSQVYTDGVDATMIDTSRVIYRAIFPSL